jgi:hypothetical protein
MAPRATSGKPKEPPAREAAARDVPAPSPAPATLFEVIYGCRRCGGSFTVRQGTAELDDDISLCENCVDELLAEGGRVAARPVSDCHGTRVTVGGNARRHWVCAGCGEACDAVPAPPARGARGEDGDG